MPLNRIVVTGQVVALVGGFSQARLVWLVPPVALGAGGRMTQGWCCSVAPCSLLVLACRAAFACPGRPRGVQGGAVYWLHVHC